MARRAATPEAVRAAAARLYRARHHIEALFHAAHALRQFASALTPEEYLALERRHRNRYQGPLDVTLPKVAFEAIGGDLQSLPAMQAYCATFDWELWRVLRGELPAPDADLSFYRCNQCPGMPDMTIAEIIQHIQGDPEAHRGALADAALSGAPAHPVDADVVAVDRVDGLPQLRLNFDDA